MGCSSEVAARPSSFFAANEHVGRCRSTRKRLSCCWCSRGDGAAANVPTVNRVCLVNLLHRAAAVCVPWAAVCRPWLQEMNADTIHPSARGDLANAKLWPLRTQAEAVAGEVRDQGLALCPLVGGPDVGCTGHGHGRERIRCGGAVGACFGNHGLGPGRGLLEAPGPPTREMESLQGCIVFALGLMT